VPVFIMTYASVVVSHGVEWFTARAAQAGASGLIVPDLPPDYDEGLYAAGREAGLHVVPVLVPSAASERVEMALATRPSYVYAALRKGITGAATEIGAENITFLEGLKARGVHVMAGFGIRSREQVEALHGHADTVVVGSAFVDVISRHESVSDLARELVSGPAL
jgi:tryptophan synthase alpha chain